MREFYHRGRSLDDRDSRRRSTTLLSVVARRVWHWRIVSQKPVLALLLWLKPEGSTNKTMAIYRRYPHSRQDSSPVPSGVLAMHTWNHGEGSKKVGIGASPLAAP